MCVCVCVRIILGKLQILVASTSYWQTSNYTRIKNSKRLLLKPCGYKVITLFLTHSYCFQTWEDSWGHLDTSKKHNYFCILLSLTKHYKIVVVVATTSSTGSKHSPLLSSYFKFSSHVLSSWGSFFLLWDKTEAKM